jgi:hypothetical protein
MVRSAVQDGTPLAGANVIVSDMTGNVVASAVTGADGGFLVEGTPAGRYAVTATASGHLPVSREIELNGHAETAQLILLPEREVYGVVRTPGGEPAPGILVTAANAAGEIVASATTDSYGRYRLTGFGDGEHALVAGGQEPVSAGVEVTSGETASVIVRLGGRPAGPDPAAPASASIGPAGYGSAGPGSGGAGSAGPGAGWDALASQLRTPHGKE